MKISFYFKGFQYKKPIILFMLFAVLPVLHAQILEKNAISLSEQDSSLRTQHSFSDLMLYQGYAVDSENISRSTCVVKGELLTHSPNTNLIQKLNGLVPGLFIHNSTGEPGNEGGELRIRGASTFIGTQPLIVIDGIPHRSLERLNATDIASIKLLKDASAAIYGMQGANGVILITTKRGKTGKPTVRFNVNSGLQQPTLIPEMADASTYSTMLNEIAYYADPLAGMNQVYSSEDIQAFADGSDPWGHPNTDWFSEVIKPWSFQRSEHVSISGGMDNMNYYFSIGDKFQDGIYYNSATSYRQQDFRSNMDLQVSKNVSVSFDVAGRKELRNYPTVDSWDNFSMLVRGKPTMPAYWPNGEPGPGLANGLNPVVTTTDATGYDDGKSYYLETNTRLKVIVPWVKGLSLLGNFSYDKHFLNKKRLQTPWYLYTWDGISYENAEPLTEEVKQGLDSTKLTRYTEDDFILTYSFFLKYQLSGGNNHLKFLAGTETQKGIDSYTYVIWENVTSNEIDQLLDSESDRYLSKGGSSAQFARRAYFGRVNYNYNSKYLAELILRYDGSTVFKKWGFFPAISVGWRISDEGFWKNSTSIIDDLLVRASWGRTGNDNIYDNPVNSYLTYDPLVIYDNGMINPGLKWEDSNQFNVGFNASLHNSQLTLHADYFYNLRTDIPYYRAANLPETSGVELPLENLLEVMNQGFEYMLAYQGGSGSLRYNISTNGCFAKSKILYYFDNPGIPDYQQYTGYLVGAGLYYEAIGIFHDQDEIDAYPHWNGAQPGDVKFRDVDENGVINGLDMVRQDKSSLPKFTGGLSANLSYKGFDIFLTLQACTGAVVYFSPESGTYGNFYEEYAINRWTEDNPDGDYPRTWNRKNEYWRGARNTFWLKETDFIRLKNLEVGYNLPKSISGRMKMQGMRIYINGSNLFTLSKLKLFDPELRVGYYYPLLRTLNTGISIEF